MNASTIPASPISVEAALKNTLLPGPFYYMYALKQGFFTDPGDVGNRSG